MGLTVTSMVPWTNGDIWSSVYTTASLEGRSCEGKMFKYFVIIVGFNTFTYIHGGIIWQKKMRPDTMNCLQFTACRLYKHKTMYFGEHKDVNLFCLSVVIYSWICNWMLQFCWAGVNLHNGCIHCNLSCIKTSVQIFTKRKHDRTALALVTFCKVDKYP